MSRQERSQWIEQAKKQVLETEKETDECVKELMFLYDEAANEIEDKINAMFARYASDNKLTHADAARLLSGKEYNKWNKSIEKYLEDVKISPESPKVLLELNTLSMKSRISRQEQLLTNIYQNMINLSGDCTTKLESLLGDMYKTHYYRSAYNLQRGLGVGFNVAKIDEKTIKHMLAYPWSQKPFSKSLWDNVDKLAVAAKREITLGFITGSSVQAMTKGINDVMDKGRYAAERLIRTECKYFANQAELEGYRANGVRRYRFLGGGEGGHCDCASLNGQTFEIEEAEPGINFPPIHPNCLCTVIADFDTHMFDDKDRLDSGIDYEDWLKKYT